MHCEKEKRSGSTCQSKIAKLLAPESWDITGLTRHLALGGSWWRGGKNAFKLLDTWGGRLALEDILSLGISPVSPVLIEFRKPPCNVFYHLQALQEYRPLAVVTHGM